MHTEKQLQKCLSIINDSLQAKCKEDIEQIWLDFQALCGIDGMLLGVSETSRDSDLADSTALWFGIPDEWLKLYLDRQYAVVDPVVRMCMEEDRIIEWREAFEKYGDEADDFVQEAEKYGLSNGYAVGKSSNRLTHIASIASITFDPNVVTVAQHVLIQQILPHLNEILTRPGFLKHQELSVREKEVLMWIEKSKSYDDIAIILGIKERTVRYHVNNIYDKYQVSDKTSAVNKAKIYGDID